MICSRFLSSSVEMLQGGDFFTGFFSFGAVVANSTAFGAELGASRRFGHGSGVEDSTRSRA